MKMLLTVALPTFNRESFIGDTLRRLIDQIPPGSTDRIEILISDNASSDGTQAVCNDYVRRYSGLVRYVRQPQNFGYDRNLEALFVHARGRHVLLVGDDDYPLPGALRYLFDLLDVDEDAAPALVYSGHDIIDSRTGEALDLREDFFQQREDATGGCVLYRSGIELCRRTDMPLYGGLTGTIFNRSAWLAADRETYIGTNFLQLAVAYQVAARHVVGLVCRSLFVVRMNGTHGWPSNDELYFGLVKAGRPLAQLYPQDVVLRLRRRHDWAVRRAIISYRGAAPDDQPLVRAIRDSLDAGRLTYWLLDMPLLLLPGSLFRLLRQARLTFRRRQPDRHLA